MPESYLVFDTETTGAGAKDDFTANPQPAPVQIYMGLYTPPDDLSEWFDTDENGLLLPGEWLQPLQTISILVSLPPGKEVEAGALKVHNIPADLANKYGMSRVNACHAFSDMVDVADVVVAHNIDFDRRIMNAMMYDEQVIDNTDPMGIFEGKELFCTMKSLTDICKIPKRTGGGYKWPSLKEAYQFFFEREFANAHDAAADSIACAKIFFVLKYLEQLEDEIPY